MGTSRASNWKTLEGVEVECTHCGVRMTCQQSPGRPVKYFRCGSCHRWVSSVYTEIFRADAKMRTFPVEEPQALSREFNEVKGRLERWLAALDDQDPYRTLGVSPLDPPDAIRARFRQLAFEAHPDRGGSTERMREINLAFERILRHRDRKRREALGAGTTVPQAREQLPARRPVS